MEMNHQATALSLLIIIGTAVRMTIIVRMVVEVPGVIEEIVVDVGMKDEVNEMDEINFETEIEWLNAVALKVHQVDMARPGEK